MMSKIEGKSDELNPLGANVRPQSILPEPHFRAFSAATRIAAGHLQTEPYKDRVILTINGTPRRGVQRAECAARFEKNLALVTNYLKWLQDNGLKLPRDPRNKKKIFYAQVAIEAGLTPGALWGKSDGEHAPSVRLLQLIDAAVSTLGSEVRVLPQSPGHPRPSFSYQQLMERGTEERQKELKGRPKGRQQVYNTRTALNRLRKSLGLEKTATIGNELASGFKTAVEKATGSISNKSSRKKFQTEIFWWHDFYGRLIKEPAIPDDLNQAIAHLCNRSGLSLSVIAKLIGIDSSLLSVWCNNSKTPSKLSIKPLELMESLFKLAAGTLTNKIACIHSKRFSRSQLPQFLRDAPKLLQRVRKHLPDDFCTLPLGKQQTIVESIRTDILRGDDEYAQRLRALIRLPYQLKEWPEPVLGEFNSYANFKMAETPPPGMKRSGTWRPTTRRKRELEFAFLFGAACLPHDAEDERLRGLDFPKSQLTLALIACPQLVEWYLNFRGTVRSQVTGYLIDLLQVYISMLRPQTGWLRQCPDLAARLTPFAQGEVSYVPQELVSRAKIDWDGVCDEAIKKYKELISEMKESVTVSRDSFHRIEGILANDNPMKPLGILIQEMKRDLPNRYTKPLQYHVGIRDIVLITLAVLTGFRRSTIVKLDYTGDETGHLYLKDGKYFLHVPRKFFKNENSSFFIVNRVRQDYIDTLPDKYGLYEVLKEYLEDSRPFLMKRYPAPTDERPLFVTSAGMLNAGRAIETPRLNAVRVSDIYASKVERYLVENKHRGTGIAKVRKTGIHSVRHVRGVKVYRKTRSFKLAGDANQNSEQTARRHYSRTTVAERNLEVNRVLLEDE